MIPRIFIGYDSNETIAYHVLAHSIMSRASRPVSITPLILDQLPMTRPRDPLQSTDFTYSRFLVPYLCGYEGQALFLDSDILCTGDICELFDMELSRAVSVVKHDYTPNPATKFLGHVQTNYPKKNWSSVMMFNCGQCRALTVDRVNRESGKYLHRLEWVEYSDIEVENFSMIGELPAAWNHLVGEEGQCALTDAKLIHYTQGTPCFAKYRLGDSALLWHAEHDKMRYYNPIGEYSHEKAPELC